MAQSEAVERLPVTKDLGPTERFVLQFFDTCAASYTEQEGVWHVILPKEIAQGLALPEEACFTFDPDLANSDLPVLTQGSPTVDAMVQMSRQRGHATQLLSCGLPLMQRLDRLCRIDPWSQSAGAIPGTSVLTRAQV